MRYPTLSKNISKFIPFFWATFFFVSMIILMKYFLVTFAGLFEPVFQWVKLTLSEEPVTNDITFQIVIICKILSLLISSGFIFVVSSAFSTVFSYIFYNSSTKNYKKVDYSLKSSIVNGIKWSFYRSFIILTPPLSVIMAGSILFLASIILFNLFMKIAGISVTLTAFIMSFIAFSIMFLFIFSLFISLWQLVSTVFGIEIAVSEPNLKNKVIEKRSKNLIFENFNNLYICLGYLALLYSLYLQMKYALTTDFIMNPENQWLFNLVILFDLVCFAVFEQFKSSAYVDSLIKHSEKISNSSIKTIKN